MPNFRSLFGFVFLSFFGLALVAFSACTSGAKKAELEVRSRLARLNELVSVDGPLALIEAGSRSQQVQKLFAADAAFLVRDPLGAKSAVSGGRADLGPLLVGAWQKYRRLALQTEGLVVKVAPKLDAATTALTLRVQGGEPLQDLGSLALLLEWSRSDEGWVIRRVEDKQADEEAGKL